MPTLVYVDNSQVSIEGMHVSAVETGLALDAWDTAAHSFTLAKPGEDDFMLVAGDAAYVPLVENLRRRGYRVDVCFLESTPRENSARRPPTSSS